MYIEVANAFDIRVGKHRSTQASQGNGVSSERKKWPKWPKFISLYPHDSEVVKCTVIGISAHKVIERMVTRSAHTIVPIPVPDRIRKTAQTFGSIRPSVPEHEVPRLGGHRISRVHPI